MAHLLQLADIDYVGRFSPQLVCYSFWDQQDHYVFQYSMLCVQVTVNSLCHQLQWASMFGMFVIVYLLALTLLGSGLHICNSWKGRL